MTFANFLGQTCAELWSQQVLQIPQREFSHSNPTSFPFNFSICSALSCKPPVKLHFICKRYIKSICWWQSKGKQKQKQDIAVRGERKTLSTAFPSFLDFPFDLKRNFRKENFFVFDVKSQHKEGLYHCERASEFMCLDLFSLFSLLCATAKKLTEGKPYVVSSGKVSCYYS